MVELLLKCNIRKAIPQDIWAIRGLVLAAFLDPTQLKVEQFGVIELEWLKIPLFIMMLK